MTTMEIDIRKGYAGAYGSLAATFEAPALTGSDKQVAWAEELRRKAVEGALYKLVASPGRAQALVDDPVGLERVKAKLAAVLQGAPAAKDWIDARGDLTALLRKLGLA